MTDPIVSGTLVIGALLALMAMGMPIAFALGFVSIMALLLTQGFGMM